MPNTSLSKILVRELIDNLEIDKIQCNVLGKHNKLRDLNDKQNV